MSEFTYSPWRHGGWYVDNVHYPSGAVGCVSKKMVNPATGEPDGRWRIACDSREGDHSYRTRDEAAWAERCLIAEGVLGGPAPLPEREIVPDPSECFHVRRNEFGAATCHISRGRARDCSTHRQVREGDPGAMPCEFVATGFCVCSGTSIPPIPASADADEIFAALAGWLPSATHPEHLDPDDWED